MIGDRIREARIAAKMTQEQLAVSVETTKQNIHKYETGIITNIPLDRIASLAIALSVTPSYLTGWGDDQRDEVTHPADRLLSAFRNDEEKMRSFVSATCDVLENATPEGKAAFIAFAKLSPSVWSEIGAALLPEHNDFFNAASNLAATVKGRKEEQA